MLTQSVIDGLASLAGESFKWEGVRGSSRPASDVRSTLRKWMADAQGGICFACGEALNDGGEFCHIVSRGPGGSSNGKGWLPLNIAVGHSVCNEAQKDNGPIVNIVDMVRPDVVQSDWPPFPVLRQMR